MAKFLFLVVTLAVAQSAHAQTRWELNCTTEKKNSRVPTYILKYKAVKQVFPNPKPTPGHKWNTVYSVDVYFKSQPSKAYTYKLTPAGSGDEDYNEYNLAGTEAQGTRINVSAAYIQNRFEWVNLIDRDGYGFADCR